MLPKILGRIDLSNGQALPIIVSNSAVKKVDACLNTRLINVHWQDGTNSQASKVEFYSNGTIAIHF